MQMLEQVLVGGIEGLQGFGLLFGLADQVESGKGRNEYRHIDCWCLLRALCATL
jgi:hypothetical protein